MIETYDLNDIITDIEKSRNVMIAIGRQKGLNDPETIKASQELDKLIIRFEQISLNLVEVS
jgi:hypothetical protein